MLPLPLKPWLTYSLVYLQIGSQYVAQAGLEVKVLSPDSALTSSCELPSSHNVFFDVFCNLWKSQGETSNWYLEKLNSLSHIFVLNVKCGFAGWRSRGLMIAFSLVETCKDRTGSPRLRGARGGDRSQADADFSLWVHIEVYCPVHLWMPHTSLRKTELQISRKSEMVKICAPNLTPFELSP